MANGGIVTGVLFSDLIFTNDPDGIFDAGQNGPLPTLPAGLTITLNASAVTHQINVNDDDMLFEDGFQDGPGTAVLNQTLADPFSATNVAGDTITVAAGQVAEVEFTVTVSQPNGPDIDLLFVASGANENGGDLFLVVSTSPVPPGVVLTPIDDADGGGTPYEDLVCFAAGAAIMTPTGDKLIEDLSAGDEVCIFGGGFAKISWIASRRIGAAELSMNPQFRPVKISKGALGEGAPSSDLRVPPQHRILITEARAEIMFGDSEVLAPAHTLCNDGSITIDRDVEEVTYYHILFDRHEIIFANGLPTESFFPGETALNALDQAARAEIETLFPDLAAKGFKKPARPMLKAYEARALVTNA